MCPLPPRVAGIFLALVRHREECTRDSHAPAHRDGRFLRVESQFHAVFLTSSAGENQSGPAAKLLRNLRPSHQHSAFSATLLLMTSVMLARVIGYLREMYVAWAFGAGPKTDAYVAAFHDSRLSCSTSWRAGPPRSPSSRSTRGTPRSGEERQAQEAFNYHHHHHDGDRAAWNRSWSRSSRRKCRALIFPKFTAEQMELCVYLTRILLPGQIFFYAGGIVSAVLLSRRMFLYPALSPGVLRLVRSSWADCWARIDSASRRWRTARWWARSSGRS